ncbi:hypothetical protein [Capnocytophaga canimorsus]|nr:hypothetical protein [Capnocytophaga canimorsus]GJQ04084.1 hypothetical protein CAPN009_04990 [Capnocytophaga canimorsus]
MKAPERYFDTFYERLAKHLDMDTGELSHGFSVPNGYFEKSKRQIYNATTQPKAQKLTLKATLRWVAVAIIVVTVPSVWFLKSVTSKQIILTQQEINNYVNNNFNETDFYWISQEISIEDIEGLALPPIENPEIIGQYLSEYAYMENTDF